MKKTVIVNINGIIFHIDEDAYGALNAYLDALHRYFDLQTEGKEIVSDIESRIAELLQPLITDIKQSVTMEDINGIIATLGNPEAITGEEPAQEKDNNETKQVHNPSQLRDRRLYRDPDNSIIAGVSSGIAAYFDIDPVLIRILFVALLFAGGISIILYPILWIVVPLAETSAQKLEMRGENVTINNIERTYHTTDRLDPDSFWGRIRSMIKELFKIIGKVFYAIWRVFSFLLGIFFILISLAIIIGLIAATFFNKFYIDAIASSSAISIQEFFNLIINPKDTTWLLIFLLIVIFIPLIWLIYAGLKLIIRFKANDKWAMLSMFLLWIAAIIMTTILVLSQVNNFRLSGYAKETIALSLPKTKTIYLNMPYPNENDEFYRMRTPPPGLFGIKIKDNKRDLWGAARIDIEKSFNSYPELEIIKEAQGFSYEEATESAKQIKINFTQADSMLTIDPTFWINQGKWKFQKTRIILHLPTNMKLILNENTRNFLDNNSYWKNDLVGKPLLMTEDGLRNVASSNETSKKTVVVKLSPVGINYKIDSILNINNGKKIISITTDSGKYLLGRPVLSFKTWNKDYISIDTRRSGPRGQSYLKYDYQLNDSIFYLPRYWYCLNKSNAMRYPIFEIQIPEGTVMYFTNEVLDYLQSRDQLLVGGTWKISRKGFKEIDKK